MPTFKKPSRGRHPKTELHWTTVQRKLLAVLEQPEHRSAGPIEICALAGYGEWAWERATKDPRFISRLQQLGVPSVRPRRGVRKYEGHLEICLADDPEQILASDVWDMRRLLPDYPRHRGASEFVVDFTCIIDPDLRAQLKLYFRQHLARQDGRGRSAVCYRP